MSAKKITYYNSEITSGGMLFNQTKIISELILAGLKHDEILLKVVNENILHTLTEKAARKYANIILRRIEHLDKKYLQYIVRGTFKDAVMLLLVIIANHSRIVGDFLIFIRREYIEKNIFVLKNTSWDTYFEQCRTREVNVDAWSDSTRIKMRRVVFSILIESGLIDSKTLSINTMHIPNIVSEYISEQDRSYERFCLQGILI